MKLFRFYIDSTLIQNEPEGWKDFEVTVRRSQTDRFLYVEYNSQLILYKTAGYDEVYAYITANNYGKLIDFEVQESTDGGSTYSTLFEGIIDVSEVEFDLHRYTAKIRVSDASLATLINKNRTLKVTTGSTSSKNGVTISNLSMSTKQLDIVTKQGTTSRDVYCLDWGSLMSYLAAYVSDNTLTVTNTFYTALNGSGDYLYITPLGFLPKGEENIELLADFDARPERIGQVTTTLNETFLGVAKLYNLWMTVVKSGANYVLVINEEDDIYSTTDAITLSAVSMKLLRISDEQFYTSIKVGQDETKNAGVYYGTAAGLYGWGSTEVQLKTNANVTDTQLDLSTSLVYSGISVLMHALRFKVNDTGLATDYVLNYNFQPGADKNALLFGTSTTIGSQSVTKDVFLAEADTAAAAADVDSIGERELLGDVDNIKTYGQFLNSGFTNDLVIARHKLPFDTIVTTNPDPSMDVALKLNANVASTTRTSYTPTTIAVDIANDLMPLRSDITGGSDPYNQWNNTDYFFKPASLPGRIDDFLCSGTIAVNVSSTTSEGFRVYIFFAQVIDGVVYYDSVASSAASTTTGLANYTITGRRYVPFIENQSLQVLCAVLPEGTNPVFAGTTSGWTGWTYNGAFWTVTNDEILGDNSGGGAVTEDIELDDDLEAGETYKLSFDYPAATGGTCTVNIYTGTTLHDSVVIGGVAGSSGEIEFTVGSAPQTNLILSCDFGAGVVAQIENFQLNKKFRVTYDIRANNTVVNIDQVGFDGSSFTAASAATFKGYEFEVEGSCTSSEFQALMDDPRKRINVGGQYGWVYEVNYNFHTGQLRGTLLSDHTNLGL